MIPLKCRKCGGNNFAIKPNEKNPNATDLYCKDCGAWQKFASKEEIRLLSKEKTADEMFKKQRYNEQEYKYPDTAKVASMFFGCGLTPPRTDCKFYRETRDACATIPGCSLQKDIGYCPCEKCDKYQSKYVLEKHKAADEMFQELGYEKTFRSVVETHKEKISYANEIFEIGVNCYEVYKFNRILKKVAAFTPLEILACAQLIKEMGGV